MFLRRRGVLVKLALVGLYLASLAQLKTLWLSSISTSDDPVVNTTVWPYPTKNQAPRSSRTYPELSSQYHESKSSSMFGGGPDAEGVTLKMDQLFSRLELVQVNDIATKHKNQSLPNQATPVIFTSNSVQTQQLPRRRIRNGTKPIMILHAGPYKTGSSFLQCVFSRTGYDLLMKDNFFYMGTCSFECKRSNWAYEFCEKHSDASFFKNGEVHPTFLSKLDELYDNGRNAMIVWEFLSDLGPIRMERFMKAMDGWDVRVILMYRRLFDWLPSLYAQKHRPLRGREQYKGWPGQPVVIALSGLRSVGRDRIPFDMYTKAQRTALSLDGMYRSTVDSLENTALHPVEQARQRWSRYVSHIAVVSMHHLPQHYGAGDPLFTHLFCDVIPLNNTCRAARNNEIQVVDAGSNERFPENYDFLAVYAHQLGLHPGGDSNMKRQDVWEAIQYRQEKVLNKTSNDFPILCISNASLDILLNYSISMEQSVFPGLKEEHEMAFDLAVRNNKFCYIDAKRTLDHEDWRDFFRPFVSLAPHVAVRDSSGNWSPQWDPMLTIQQLFFSHGEVPKLLRSNLVRFDFLGFIHASYTDGTRLLDFLRGSEQVGPFSRFLGQGYFEDEKIEEAVIGCVYGQHLSGQNPSLPPQQCPLSRYATLVGSWIRSLPHVIDSQLPSNSNSGKMTPMQLGLTTVTLVRDPLDRWISYFHEWRNETLWQPFLAEDFENFLQSHASQPYEDNRPLHALDQYQYIAGELNRAIGLIQGDTPRVMALVQECWDSSLRLLSVQFPSLISKESIEEFLRDAAGGTSTLNWVMKEQHYDVGVDIPGLRAKARKWKWLAPDYKYYDAAVDRFKKLLAASNITTQEESLGCIHKLS